MAIGTQSSGSELINITTNPGEIASRFSVLGDPKSDTVEATAVLAELDDDQVIYDEEFPGIPIVHYATAVRVRISTQYSRIGKDLPLDVLAQSRSNMSFHQDDRMLLTRPVSDEHAITSAIADLTDNGSFQANNYSWQVSAVGLMANIRPLSRALFVASGQPELNEQFGAGAGLRTDPERRADLMSYVATRAIDGFMHMPIPS